MHKNIRITLQNLGHFQTDATNFHHRDLGVIVYPGMRFAVAIAHNQPRLGFTIELIEGSEFHRILADLLFPRTICGPPK